MSLNSRCLSCVFFEEEEVNKIAKMELQFQKHKARMKSSKEEKTPCHCFKKGSKNS